MQSIFSSPFGELGSGSENFPITSTAVSMGGEDHDKRDEDHLSWQAETKSTSNPYLRSAVLAQHQNRHKFFAMLPSVLNISPTPSLLQPPGARAEIPNTTSVFPVTCPSLRPYERPRHGALECGGS
ncbi:unnamed protein product [Calypogeia fissa]